MILVATAAFILRLALLPYGNHPDLITNTGWSEWIYLHGARGFYENRVWVYDWPTQLPLINLIYGFNYIIYGKILWIVGVIRSVLAMNNFLPGIFKYWFNFETWFGWTYYLNTPFTVGEVISMKLIPVLSDMLIGVALFLLGSKYANPRKAVLVSVIYLFIPYTIYLSSLWGQYDQLSALTLLLSFYFLYLVKGKVTGITRWVIIFLSAAFYFISVEVKPTAVFTAPFYIYLIIRGKLVFKDVMFSAVTAVLLFWITTLPFSGGNPFSYTLKTIIPEVFNQTRNVLSTQSFNFWELVSPMKQNSLSFSVVGIRSLYLGYLILLVLNAIAICLVYRKNDLKNILAGLFVITGGSYMFVTGMLDRYYFAGLLFFLVLAIFYKKILPLWFAAAILFSLNLFFSWGYPVNLQLHDVVWSDFTLVRVLSLMQVVIFLLAVRILIKDVVTGEVVKSRLHEGNYEITKK
jgi:hypothetical protein